MLNRVSSGMNGQGDSNWISNVKILMGRNTHHHLFPLDRKSQEFIVDDVMPSRETFVRLTNNIPWICLHSLKQSPYGFIEYGVGNSLSQSFFRGKIGQFVIVFKFPLCNQSHLLRVLTPSCNNGWGNPKIQSATKMGNKIPLCSRVVVC